MRKQCFRNLKKCKKITEKYVLEVCFTLIIIIYSGYPLHRSVFQWGPAKIMYNTVTIQCDTIIRDTISFFQCSFLQLVSLKKS